MEMLARIRLTAPAVGEWLDKNVISALSQFITSPSGRGRNRGAISGEGIARCSRDCAARTLIRPFGPLPDRSPGQASP